MFPCNAHRECYTFGGDIECTVPNGLKATKDSR